MQFQPESIEKILAGKKTQTRRPALPSDEIVRTMTQGKYPERGVYQVFRNGRLHWQCGKTYAVCPGRGKKQVARIKVWRIKWEDVRNMSYEDIIAEGFEHPFGFLETWCGFYDPPYIETMKAEAHLSSAPGARASLRLRPNELYQAWALTFEHDDEQRSEGDE